MPHWFDGNELPDQLADISARNEDDSNDGESDMESNAESDAESDFAGIIDSDDD